MDKKELFDAYVLKLENVKDDLHPSDFRFYNISHLPLIIKNTIENSETCQLCNENINPLDELVNSMPNCFENSSDRKKFEQNKHKIEKHLKKGHGMKLPGYYTALFSFIGIITAIIAAIFIHLLKEIPLFNEVILITLALGILIGRGIGSLLDRNIFSKNLQL